LVITLDGVGDGRSGGVYSAAGTDLQLLLLREFPVSQRRVFVTEMWDYPEIVSLTET
jgi:hypothetical protein